jgi:NRPS condensation-like uncharacterized protein
MTEMAIGPNSYPAESADIKHFLSGEQKRNDHVLHAVIRYDGLLAIDLLKQAVAMTLRAVPLLTCRFVINRQRAFWQQTDDTVDEIVRFVETEQREEAVRKNLVIKPDATRGPQMRLSVIRCDGIDTLVIVLNHMICDGGGFRDYLYLLASCYSALASRRKTGDPAVVVLPDPSRRSIDQVFNQLNPEQLKRVKMAAIESAPQSEKDALPLVGDDRCPFILTHDVAADRFDTIRRYAKSRGATINDALFAAYVLALSEVLSTETIALDCPVNLRAYLPKHYLPGICNLTANILCTLPNRSGASYDDVLLEVSRIMNRQKQNVEPLKVYWELEHIYRTLPLAEAVKKFPRIYRIPLNGLTNIGILDDDKLKCGNRVAEDAFISGSIKYKPYFQIAVTTFRKKMTFCTNFHGNEKDRRFLDRLVKRMIDFLPR